MEKIYTVKIGGGDEVTVVADVEDQRIRSAKWTVIGRSELITKAKEMSLLFKGDISNLVVPKETDAASLILKSLILKLKGEWPGEPNDPELCHCRKVPQLSVERAIILGAHDVESLRQRSSAGTGCGTCLPDMEEVLSQYIINSPSS